MNNKKNFKFPILPEGTIIVDTNEYEDNGTYGFYDTYEEMVEAEIKRLSENEDA